MSRKLYVSAGTHVPQLTGMCMICRKVREGEHGLSHVEVRSL